MQTQTPCPESRILDIRKFPGAERDMRVMTAFEAIQPHCSFLIITDTEPVTLKKEFEAEMTDRFLWELVESGPSQWKVMITRLQ